MLAELFADDGRAIADTYATMLPEVRNNLVYFFTGTNVKTP